MNKPDLKEILKRKIEYYGYTGAAITFALEEYDSLESKLEPKESKPISSEDILKRLEKLGGSRYAECGTDSYNARCYWHDTKELMKNTLIK